MVQGWRLRSPSISLLGGFGALWAASELLLQMAVQPGEFAVLRRLLYLGVYGVTFSWFWVAVEADAPPWWREGHWRIGIAGAPLVLIYSCLYWAPDGLLISLYSPTPRHGPLFPVAAGASWALIIAGLSYYSRAGILVPLGANILYAFGFITGIDPSPAFLGFSALMIRFAVIDVGLSRALPLARSDIIEQLAVGVVVMDREDRVINANPSARQLLRVAHPEGVEFSDLAQKLDETVEVLRFPLRRDVHLARSAAVLTDRCEAIRAEQRLQLAARLEALGSLTAGIAHEVNNPLAYIQSNLSFIEKVLANLNAPEIWERLPAAIQPLVRDGIESLVDARDGIDRISLLVARLRGFAVEPSEPIDDAELDLLRIAGKAAAVAGVGLPDNAIEIHSAFSEPVMGNEHAVVQILVNLILNAIQASDDSPRLEIKIREAGCSAEIRVSDHGAGLDLKTIDQIFDPFFTTKHSGSGLGLSISFDLARRLGGRIEAANRPGGGAVFSLFLPRS